MKTLLATTALTALVTHGAFAAGPFTLGMMNGGEDYASSITELQQFEAASGVTPLVYNTYMNLSVAPSAWPGSASYIASLAGSTAPYNTGCSTGKCSYIPMIGMPITTTYLDNADNDTLLKAEASGQYDAQIEQYVTDFANQGFKTQYWRPGVEMNYSSTPGDVQGSEDADWIAAYKRVYTDLHAAATADGVTVKVIWNAGLSGAQPTGNPTSGLDSSPAGVGFWPGKQYVDIIGGDLYSDLYPQGGSNPYDWAANGQKYGGSIYDTSLAQFASNPINLEHYYSYPDSNGSGPDYSCPNNGNGYAPGTNCGGTFSLLNMIAWAKLQGLPIALPETGTDQGNGGPVDNPTFPLWLASAMSYAVSQGVPVAVVSIWDDPSGCTCSFTPTTADGSTVTAAAWTASFGAKAPAVPPNLASIIEVSGATGGTTSTPKHAASPADTQINGTTGTIYDTAGNAWTITSAQTIAENGTPIPVSADVVTLFWNGTALFQLNTSGDWWTQPLTGAEGTELSAAPAGYVAPKAASPADTQVNAGSTASITDTLGNVWTLNAANNLVENGVLSTAKYSYGCMFWTGTALYVLSSGGYWVSVNLSTGAGTVVSAAPAGYKHIPSPANTQVNGTKGTIYDAAGNAWTITSAGQLAENGKAVAGSEGVETIMWTGSTLLQLNWNTQVDVATNAPTGYVVP